MYGYIYITTNHINNKQYIGKKKSDHFCPEYLGSGVRLHEAINKYGVENFSSEMIDTAESIEELNEKEKYYIAKYNAVLDENFYNIASGGGSGMTAHHHSEKTRQKISDSEKGKSMTQEAKDKIHQTWIDKSDDERKQIHDKYSESHKGIKHTEEQKKKSSESLKEYYKTHPGSNFGKPAWNKGIELSEEQKVKLQNLAKGRIWIHNQDSSKMIYPEEKGLYLNNGWKLGRGKIK